MSVFDLIIFAILAVLTLRGIWKGMVSQIVSVASYFVCWLVATRFGSLVAPTIPLEAPWDQVVAMAVIFFITLIGIRFARAALEKLIKDWHLEKLNKALGGALGFTKGLLLCLIITFFAVMLSETSRAVVFNSKSGSHLVQLITQISLFVPKDSYEFVHAQFAYFQSKVGEAVPGQAPQTVSVQSSETVQEMFAKLQRKEPSASSLYTALSNWWNGSKDDTAEAGVSTMTPQAAIPYSPPLPSSVPPANTYTNVPQTATPTLPAVEEFFVRQTVSSVSQPVQQSMAFPPVPETESHQFSLSSPLMTLAPLSEVSPTLPELTQLLPMVPMPHHVGSDLLLHNSGRPTNPNSSAQVFQPR